MTSNTPLMDSNIQRTRAAPALTLLLLQAYTCASFQMLATILDAQLSQCALVDQHGSVNLLLSDCHLHPTSARALLCHAPINAPASLPLEQANYTLLLPLLPPP
jgi:hypothetical protein